MNIYLAGPMRGIPEFNFPVFNKAAARLRELGHTVFNPAEKGDEALLETDPELQDNLSFRRKVFKIDTAYICDYADALMMLDGWKQSKGALAEYALAAAIGIPAYEYVDVPPHAWSVQ